MGVMHPHFNAFVILAALDDFESLSDSLTVAFGPDGCPCSYEIYNLRVLEQASRMKEVQEDHILHMVVLHPRADVPAETLELLYDARVIIVRMGQPADWKPESLGERRVFSVLNGGELADFSFRVKDHLKLPHWEVK